VTRRAAAVLAVLLVAACGDDAAKPAGGGLEAVPVAGAPQRGPADAWVTVVEFADFQCPYCIDVQPALAALVAAYPDDVRLVHRHYPLSFHERARPAAIAAACADEQGRFWAYADAAWANGGALSEASLVALAGVAGIPDLSAWSSCRAGAAAGARVDADRALGQAHGVSGTPWFFVNGEPLVGAVPYADLQAAFLAARTRAIASGIPRANYYAVAVLGEPAP